ncbi:MAG: IS605 OrfB-like transposable element containing RNAse H-like and Zn finger domain [Candidatus Methanohalarchaeum thermophilum]|uniref:IS605 OrfB-like transposable element containing RNAse H-like and Zn finger domain n=1 Tax=Methanohalarchaeum thermophilum TaxID=1903181 RepID=A0A1Q6DU68_METT1|nr:MAG: IS605 OrfB-like transposable element containing RNAse H-like and Zn finger domain [Candidatus Methanohalarchaeum thermophilum]
MLTKLHKLVSKYVEVETKNTTKSCLNLGCGNEVNKELSDRVHEGRERGLEIDRDLNAATNIVSRGIGLVGQGLSEVKALVHINLCWN